MDTVYVWLLVQNVKTLLIKAPFSLHVYCTALCLLNSQRLIIFPKSFGIK
jgi:hypothetical protein